MPIVVTRRMLYRYQDGERRPGQTIQLRLAHLTDVVSTLGTARNDHGIVRWFTEVRADGDRPAAMLPGRWRPLDEGPRQVMAMAVRESPELRRPKTVLRTTGRMPTLSLVHDVIAGFCSMRSSTAPGSDRVRLHRYRRGETWPSWDTQRQFRELLATDPVANMPDPLPAR